jgi:hypothetical protein
MSDPCDSLRVEGKERPMHKATITSRSEISGERVYTVEDENLLTFYAQIVGAVQGITAAGSVVVSVISSKEG